MTEPIFTTTRLDRVRAAADRAVPFLDRAGYPLGAAWVRHHWQDGSSRAVIDALAAHQPHVHGEASPDSKSTSARR